MRDPLGATMQTRCVSIAPVCSKAEPKSHQGA